MTITLILLSSFFLRSPYEYVWCMVKATISLRGRICRNSTKRYLEVILTKVVLKPKFKYVFVYNFAFFPHSLRYGRIIKHTGSRELSPWKCIPNISQITCVDIFHTYTCAAMESNVGLGGRGECGGEVYVYTHKENPQRLVYILHFVPCNTLQGGVRKCKKLKNKDPY